MLNHNTNKALKSFTKFGLTNKPIKPLYQAFLRAGIDANDARAAAVICANKNLNGGQMAGFSTVYAYPMVQMGMMETSTDQVIKTFNAIKPETLEVYKLAIAAIMADNNYKSIYSQIIEA